MNFIKAKLKKFKALSWPERRILFSAMALLPLFWLGLRVLGLCQLQTWLQRNTLPANSTLSQDDIVRMATLVNIAAQQPFIPASCLTRSLLLRWLLGRRGIATQLRIGVRTAPGNFEAHAWVEYTGLPINDQLDISEQFSPFPEIFPNAEFKSL